MKSTQKILLKSRSWLGVVKSGTQRTLSSQTQKIIPSPFPNIQIPNIPLDEYVWKNINKWSDKTALVCNETGKSYTYAKLRDKCHNVAQALRARLGLSRGDILAVMSPNVPDFCTVLLGCLEAGIVVTTLNPIYTPDEIAKQLEDSGAKAMVTLCSLFNHVNDGKKLLKGEASQMPVITIKFKREDTTPNGTVDFEELCNYNGPKIDLGKSKMDDLALLPYSSGTTGLPKGVLLTHRSITSNLEQLCCKDIQFASDTTSEWQDRISLVLPLYHIYGMIPVCFNGLSRGCQVVTMPKFHPDSYLSMLRKYKPTLLYTAPPLVIFLNNHQSVVSSDLSEVRKLICGAAPLAGTDIDRFNSKFSRDGTSLVVQGYGLTEASPITHVQKQQMDTRHVGIGSGVPSTLCRIVGIDDRLDKGVGESGELWVKGPQVMKGYHNNTKATEETITKDGWLQTGDIAHYDETGQFHITDRLKELIKVKGFQVAPAELEGLLRHHPDILDAAVTGIDHPKFGQAPKAYVVKKPDSKVNQEHIQAYIAGKVAPFKHLVGGVIFVESIPKTPSGKIMRRLLKNL